jgi:hypothetical protein
MFRSILDPLLSWPDAAALTAWKEEHPDDIRGQVVEFIANPQEAP